MLRKFASLTEWHRLVAGIISITPTKEAIRCFIESVVRNGNTALLEQILPSALPTGIAPHWQGVLAELKATYRR